MLDSSRLQTLIARPSLLLENIVERRVKRFESGHGNAGTEEQWLHSLGQILTRLSDDHANQALLEADRRSAERLSHTRWIPAKLVVIQPYLDGVPVGMQSELSMAWIGTALYVQGDSVRAYKSLVKEISSPFTTAAAVEIIRDCVGREANWIQAYAEEHLKLVDSASASLRQERDVQSRPEIVAPGSVFPLTDHNSQCQPIQQQRAAPEAEPKLDLDRHTPDLNPGKGDKPSTPKQLSRLDRLGTFLASRGFWWDEASDRFTHQDGSYVCRSDGTFTWELVAIDHVSALWLAQSSFSDRDGIEIPAEVWNEAKRNGAVLLAPEGDSFREYHFSALRAELDARRLEMYPVLYRIRVADGGDDGPTK